MVGCVIHAHSIGEFGIVFKAQLLNWYEGTRQLTVAVKALKCKECMFIVECCSALNRQFSEIGINTTSDVEKMLAEIAKMENLNHPNLMPLIGVCIDEDHRMCIVMPFMPNGSLLGYLKRERDNLYLNKKAKEDVVSGAS